MKFDEIIGHSREKEELNKMLNEKKIPQTIFFLGKEELGTLDLALAFTKKILTLSNDKKVSMNFFNHPDFHFFAPTSNDEKSKNFSFDWRKFLSNNTPYASFSDWLKQQNIEGKNNQIGIDAVSYILKIIKLKPYSGGYRVIIIWKPEKLNLVASNKLLKTLEEPYDKNIFLFVGENLQNVLPTLSSRFHIMHLKSVDEKLISQNLMKKKGLSVIQAEEISQIAQGNWKKALSILEKKDQSIEENFIYWMRISFSTIKNKKDFIHLISHVDKLASQKKEKQLEFIKFSIDFFEKALIASCGFSSKRTPFFSDNFNWKGSCSFFHQSNIKTLFTEFNKSIIEIERNANSKLIFFHLSMTLNKNIYKIT